MEPELAIESSREAIKVCLMVGGPILAVCLIVGVLMGLAQAMSHIQDQALATVPKILAILAVVGLALPWLAEKMMEFSTEQFSKPMLAVNTAPADVEPVNTTIRSLLEPEIKKEDSYYQSPVASQLKVVPVSTSMPVLKSQKLAPSDKEIEASRNPFTLPSYRFSRKPGDNIEG